MVDAATGRHDVASTSVADPCPPVGRMGEVERSKVCNRLARARARGQGSWARAPRLAGKWCCSSPPGGPGRSPRGARQRVTETPPATPTAGAPGAPAPGGGRSGGVRVAPVRRHAPTITTPLPTGRRPTLVGVRSGRADRCGDAPLRTAGCSRPTGGECALAHAPLDACPWGAVGGSDLARGPFDPCPWGPTLPKRSGRRSREQRRASGGWIPARPLRLAPASWPAFRRMSTP
jgi:hypothetical protein